MSPVWSSLLIACYVMRAEGIHAAGWPFTPGPDPSVRPSPTPSASNSPGAPTRRPPPIDTDPSCPALEYETQATISLIGGAWLAMEGLGWDLNTLSLDPQPQGYADPNLWRRIAARQGRAQTRLDKAFRRLEDALVAYRAGE
jgi:hypothetical protein